MNQYKVFVSHGSHDSQIAEQIAKSIRSIGAASFLDEKNIPKGRNFKKRIYVEELSNRIREIK